MPSLDISKTTGCPVCYTRLKIAEQPSYCRICLVPLNWEGTELVYDQSVAEKLRAERTVQQGSARASKKDYTKLQDQLIAQMAAIPIKISPPEPKPYKGWMPKNQKRAVTPPEPEQAPVRLYDFDDPEDAIPS
jgi:hypothetical protein